MKQASQKTDSTGIEFKNYLDTIKQNNTAEISVKSYSEIGFKIKSILRVCMQAMDIDGTSNIATESDFQNVLQIASDLVPMSEFELLDKLKD